MCIIFRVLTSICRNSSAVHSTVLNWQRLSLLENIVVGGAVAVCKQSFASTAAVELIQIGQRTAGAATCKRRRRGCKSVDICSG